ncbi:MAG: S-adenosylmethionine:tRNA ribosyltransferase-isomerase [Muribaculaceae bacterium]|nr:S-adenosylmethionine:tRNA ribosyltransferase-isomerase [Muribaculaceae bacterium]
MTLPEIKIEDFDYPLPQERIAQHPLEERDACKLLVRDASGAISDRLFSELPDILPSDTLLVYNNTKVINARLRFRKDSGALIEVFCLEPDSPADYVQSFAATGRCSWTCFVGNSKRWKSGMLTLDVTLADGKSVPLMAERVGRDGNASVVEFSWDPEADVTFSQIIEAAGEIPIPPYLNRSTESSDLRDYQTVYSHIEGSVAAPTAGLHFTPRVLDGLDRRGVLRRELTLHVGAGTFQPVKTDTVNEHAMHSEFIEVPLTLIEELAHTDRRIVAVGTTSVRTLESLYHLGCMAAAGRELDEVPQWYPYAQEHPHLSRTDALEALAAHLRAKGQDRLMSSTRIIIVPGYEFKVVEGMVTNFHQPCSTLLLLVSAFTGGDWQAMYAHALDADYRFLSYGDASLLL